MMTESPDGLVESEIEAAVSRMLTVRSGLVAAGVRIEAIHHEVLPAGQRQLIDDAKIDT